MASLAARNFGCHSRTPVCEDELAIPAGPPVEVGHEMDSELEKVFIDVASLPTMVTPVCDMDGALRVPQAECPVIALPAMSAFPGGAETFGGGLVCAPDVSVVAVPGDLVVVYFGKYII